MVSVISWWVAAQLIGLTALPLAWRLFARLPGRAYPLVKPLGLLLVSYVLWFGASFHVLPNSLGGILVALLIVAALSVLIGRDGLQREQDGRRPLFAWLREHRGLVLVTELLFAFVFAAWAAFRAYNPDIAGTEKPMEFAFINGVLGSRLFPPQDPWLSGYSISYYYFGYVMLAVLIRLTGVLPEVGFNLGVAMWYALVMTSAFGVVYTLVALSRHREGGETARREELSERQHDSPRAIRWGLLGAVMLGFMANLQGLLDSAYQRSLLPLNVIQWFNIKGLTDEAPTGNWTGGFWWWWRASRVIHDQTLPLNGQRTSVEVIDEFPFFSFLLGDLHPHVLGLPFVLLAVACCLNLFVGASQDRSEEIAQSSRRSKILHLASALGRATSLSLPGVLIYAIILGGVAFLNTWDFPIYVGLAALAFGAGYAARRGLSGRAIAAAAVALVILGGLGYVAYAPFYIGFQSQLGGILPNLFFPSRFSQFFLMFGPFLVIAVFFLLLLSRLAGGRRIATMGAKALPATLLVPVAAVALIALGFVVLPQGREQLQGVLQQPEIAANVGDATLGSLLRLVLQVRAGSPWTYLVLAVLLAWAIGVALTILAARRPQNGVSTTEGAPLAAAEGTEALPRWVAVDVFAVLLIFIALALALFPEFLYLRDLFGSRMNTVFKFYYQAWALLAVACAYGLSRLASRATPAVLRVPAVVLSALLILGGLWYPVLAIPSKADDFRGEPTLNGLAFLERSNPADTAAITWLRANVRRDVVVLEARGDSYQDLLRVSMSTGNPTLLGWDWHERQWRGNAGFDRLAAMRPAVIDQVYRSARPEELPALLAEWEVDFVVVGNLERTKYGVGDAALARFDAALKKVYDAEGVRIYAR